MTGVEFLHNINALREFLLAKKDLTTTLDNLGDRGLKSALEALENHRNEPTHGALLALGLLEDAYNLDAQAITRTEPSLVGRAYVSCKHFFNATRKPPFEYSEFTFSTRKALEGKCTILRLWSASIHRIQDNECFEKYLGSAADHFGSAEDHFSKWDWLQREAFDMADPCPKPQKKFAGMPNSTYEVVPAYKYEEWKMRISQKINRQNATVSEFKDLVNSIRTNSLDDTFRLLRHFMAEIASLN